MTIVPSAAAAARHYAIWIVGSDTIQLDQIRSVAHESNAQNRRKKKHRRSVDSPIHSSS